MHTIAELFISAIKHPILFLKWLRAFSFFAKSQQWIGGRGNQTNFQMPQDEPALPVNRLSAYFERKTSGRGIWKWRHYFEVYERHLSRFVGRDVRLLEIGIYSGGSLEMWRDYFGEGCQIIGVDIEAACKVYESYLVKVVIGDQESKEFWTDFKANNAAVDIIIDDGGHSPNQQRVTFEEAFPLLKPGGVFICEDIHGTFNPFSFYSFGVSISLNGMEKKKGFEGVVANASQQNIASVNFYPYITVIEKNAARVDSLIAPKRGTEWQPFL